MDSFDEEDDDERIVINKLSNRPRITNTEVTLMVPSEAYQQLSQPPSRRMTGDNTSLQEPILTLSRRPSAVMQTIRRQSVNMLAQRRLFMEMLQGRIGGSKSSLPTEDQHSSQKKDPDNDHRLRNRRIGDDALTTSLSAFYAKFLVVLGIAFPVTDILSFRANPSFYQGFYLYLYVGSVAFVAYMYTAHLRTRAVFSMIDSFQDNKNPIIKKPIQHYGSFYLRVGAIAFGIGSMVYSGLEFGQYFELKGEPGCNNVLIALTPAARTILSIVQMQFIFLNTKEFEMDRNRVIARFGLMHMVATNLCEWLYLVVEETKHEIHHLAHSAMAHENTTAVINNATTIANHVVNNASTVAHHVVNNASTVAHHVVKRAVSTEIVIECRRTNIMGSLVQSASPFLFPCTIEYSLICAVILFEMWKHIKGLDSRGHHPPRKISTNEKGAHQFSVDCSRAHKGMFAGILVIVLAIISLIMYYVLSDVPEYQNKAILEVTITELVLNLVTMAAVILAYKKMRDLKFAKNSGALPLDCTLLLLAQTGVYIYSMFAIIGCYFTIQLDESEDHGGTEGLVTEVFSLVQASIQTIFILNSWYRRCRSSAESRCKPGRETITFLLVSNMAMWVLNTLVKNRAMFRPTHLQFFGVWAWTIITHVSMPLAIFYRFHSTICLFEIWKTAYKFKKETVVSYH